MPVSNWYKMALKSGELVEVYAVPTFWAYESTDISFLKIEALWT